MLLLFIVIDKVARAVALAASVTRKVADAVVPAAVGVPEMTPLELSDNPAGNIPEAIDQV